MLTDDEWRRADREAWALARRDNWRDVLKILAVAAAIAAGVALLWLWAHE